MEVKFDLDLEALLENPEAKEIIANAVIAFLENEDNAVSADYIKDVVKGMIDSGEITAEVEPADVILSAN
jgi:putative heme iron utilization protein